MKAPHDATNRNATDPPPSLDDIDLLSPDTYVPGVPHETFKLLRKDAPVSWQKDARGPGFWALVKYQDVVAVSRDPKTFSSARRTAMPMEMEPEALAENQLILINTDPPRHSQLRGLVNKGFTPRMVGRLEPHIREIAANIVDAVAPKGRCDFVTDIAAELPLQVIAEMMGVPFAERQALFSWSNRLIGNDDPEYATTADQANRLRWRSTCTPISLPSSAASNRVMTCSACS